MNAMKDHVDIAERQRWNAFKKTYRESHASKIRNTQYHKHVRTIYRNQDKPNLDPWLNMPPKQSCWFVYPHHSYTEQEIIKLNRSRQGRPHTDNTSYEDLTDAEKHEVDGLKKAIEEIQDSLLQHSTN